MNNNELIKKLLPTLNNIELLSIHSDILALIALKKCFTHQE